jgi:hypothetical protein
MQGTGWVGPAVAVVLAGCGSGAPAHAGGDGQDGGTDFGPPDAGGYVDGGPSLDASWPMTDGGFVAGDAGTIRTDRFITKVVSVTYGSCAGYGQAQMPQIVEGPPIGGGADQGSVDVVSLGGGGEIVVSFEPNAIVDGPGVDLLVFENPFYIGGNPSHIYAEPGEVSVSDDGVTWRTFPCTATSPPYGPCAGWHVVYSNPTNGISPVDPAVAGGDPFDLHDVGLTRARYVRVVDKTMEPCPSSGPKPTQNGFDLDAMAIVNPEIR